MAEDDTAPKALEVYLNDHLAGAKGALDLMDDIAEAATDQELDAFIEWLRAEVTADREQLESVMERLGVPRGRLKQVAASWAESLSRLKLSSVGSPAELSQLMQLESLSAGIWMKQRLWRSLAASEELRPSLDGIDLEVLITRADEQLEALEEHRVRAATRTLPGNGSSRR